MRPMPVLSKNLVNAKNFFQPPWQFFMMPGNSRFSCIQLISLSIFFLWWSKGGIGFSFRLKSINLLFKRYECKCCFKWWHQKRGRTCWRGQTDWQRPQRCPCRCGRWWTSAVCGSWFKDPIFFGGCQFLGTHLQVLCLHCEHVVVELNACNLAYFGIADA